MICFNLELIWLYVEKDDKVRRFGIGNDSVGIEEREDIKRKERSIEASRSFLTYKRLARM